MSGCAMPIGDADAVVFSFAWTIFPSSRACWAIRPFLGADGVLCLAIIFVKAWCTLDALRLTADAARFLTLFELRA